MKKLSRFPLFLAALMMLLILAACSTADEPEVVPTQAPVEPTAAPAEPTAAPEPTDEPEPTAEPAPDPVTIEIFYPVAVDAPIASILAGYISEFEAENPNISVEAVFSGGYGDVKTAIQTTIEGGGQPPALGLMLAADLFDLANAGTIAPLDGMITDDAFLGDFIPAFMENSYFDEQLWGIPFQRSVVLLYYNKDMLAELGMEAPTSWDELAAAAAAMTSEGDDGTNWGMQWPSGWPYWLFQPLAIGAGQNIVSESDTEVLFNDPAVIEAVQFYIDLSAEHNAMAAGVQGVWPSAPVDFAAGTTGMIMHSSGSLPSILEQADFEVGVMALPGKDAGTYGTVVGGGNLYIMDGAPDDQKAAAVKFIEFLTDATRAADFSTQTGYIAARESSYASDVMQAYIAEVPQAADARDALQYAGREFSLQGLGEVRNIFHDYLQQAYNGELSAADAMAQAQEEADAALDAYR